MAITVLRLGSPRKPDQGLVRTWNESKRMFHSEMKEPSAARVLDLLAALSHQTNFSLGCYCENEERCHRSVLKELLTERGAAFVR